MKSKPNYGGPYEWKDYDNACIETCPDCAGNGLQPGGKVECLRCHGDGKLYLDFTYALPYSSLQEIHVLAGMVYGSKMNLPVRMIAKAHQVHSLMLNLKQHKA